MKIESPVCVDVDLKSLHDNLEQMIQNMFKIEFSLLRHSAPKTNISIVVAHLLGNLNDKVCMSVT